MCLPETSPIKLLEEGFEVVHTIDDYYDGPTIGIANFEGKPHHYKCIFNETEDEWSRDFLLKPLDKETFKICMESWGIWLRWRAAYDSKQTSIETHPALPSERKKYEKIKRQINSKLERVSDKEFKAKGIFKVIREDNISKTCWLVKWEVI